MMSSLDRLLDLVRRDLHAEEVEIAGSGGVLAATPTLLVAHLDDGRHLVARFPEPPGNVEAVARRFQALIETFTSMLAGFAPPYVGAALHANVGDALHVELSNLAARARALDAVVIDAHSPVVWGAATRPRGGDALDGLPDTSRAVLEHIRALPAIEQLAKGKHLRHMVADERGGYVAHSFASIYVLVLVFRELYDELRAEREVLEALPRIEALVLALPPIDPAPTPTEEVLSFRRRSP